MTVWQFLSSIPGNFVVVWTEPILHVDMDSFFVEVERLADPSLRKRPVAVGGTGKRGVIVSASYEARKFGVRSAQPTATALLLCKDLIVVSPVPWRYREVSEKVFTIFRSFTPHVEGLSLDEAFLDVAGLRRHYESSVAVAQEVRAKLGGELQLPSSAGIAATKFVAKLASKAAKPDGCRHVPKSDQLQFIQALTVESLWGVGPATLAGLTRLGVVLVGDLVEIPETTVMSTLGPAHGRHLLDLANGIDPRPVISDSDAKSLSVEETFVEDLVGREIMEAVLLSHSHRLSNRLRRAGLAARTITVKVKYSDFTTATRSITVGAAVANPRDLFGLGRDALGQHDLGHPIRLLGLGAASLVGDEVPRQMQLGGDDGWDRFADAVANVKERFGDDSVLPARLLDSSRFEAEADQ